MCNKNLYKYNIIEQQKIASDSIDLLVTFLDKLQKIVNEFT